MKDPKLVILCLFLLFTQSYLAAQDKLNIKFGKVSLQDFNLSKHNFDSSANAIVIADIGSSHFEGNSKSGFSILFTHFKRVKILNKNGFDAATVSIPLYTNGEATEALQNLQASTYNMENGKIIETKLDQKSIFTDKARKTLVLKKFTFPSVKEGSIIEFSYTQSSDFLYNLQPWAFQGGYPILWSEYEVSIPEYFNYVTISQGYQDFSASTSKSVPVHFSVTIDNGAEQNERLNMDGNAQVRRWVIKDVPPLKEERFTTTLDNHIEKVEFQLAQIQYPNTIPKTIMGNWVTMNEKLMKDESFGADIKKNNGWMDDDLKSITKGVEDNLAKAQKIYDWLRDHFTCTEYNRVFTDNSLKTVYKNRSGSEAEINLLLTAMLDHEKINADPVILSTRRHGFTSPIYPLMDRFNYVVVSAVIGNNVYYLDASRPKLGFGYLPEYCYNGHARLINEQRPAPVYFEADSIRERNLTSVFIINDEKKPGVMDGSLQSMPGYFESYDLREDLDKRSVETYFKDIKSAAGSDMDIQNSGIDSLNLLECPVKIHYEFSLNNMAGEDLLYFNPMMSHALKENPFKAAERKYPVEMPYTSDDIYSFKMDIPKGYDIDEVPKSARVTLNDGEGFFEYLVQKGEDNVQLRSRIRINRANFSPADYGTLRDFYTYIVKKESEQIVFKKK